MSTLCEFDFISSEINPGLSVIEASAGTGKTYSISHLVPRFLLDGSVGSLREILLVTYTNDAARELSDRVRRVLEKLYAPADPDEEHSDNGIFRLREAFPEERRSLVIGRALLEIDRLGVSTIHSFCQRTLQIDGTLCGLPVLPDLIPDADEAAEMAMRDIWEGQIAKSSFLAELAATKGWTVEDGIDFVRKTLPLISPVPVPEVMGFKEAIKCLEALAAQLTPQVWESVEYIFAQVPKWNASKAPDEEGRIALIAKLKGANSFFTPGMMEAVGAISQSPSWVEAKSKVGKALKSELSETAAISLCNEAIAILNSLHWEFQVDSLESVRKTVENTLRTNRQITYDGLIKTVFDALEGPARHMVAARLRQRYKVALIDESQDTDPRQFQIFRRVFVGFEGEEPLGCHRLILIGDPKQAIYSFRGADVNTYLQARKEAGSNAFQLTKTFRSPAPLVEAANAFFVRPNSLLKEGLDFSSATSGLDRDVHLVVDGKESHSRIDSWIVGDEDAGDYSNGANRLPLIAEAVAAEIVRILNASATIVDGCKESSRIVEPRDFAVLVNNHFQAATVTETLKEHGVPAIRAGAADVMDSDEAKDLLSILKAIEKPKPKRLRNAALSTRLLGYNTRNLIELTKDDDSVLDDFLRWKATLQRNGVAAVLAQIDLEMEVTKRLAATENGERRITNLRQLTDLLQSAYLEHGNHSGQLLHWFAQEIGRSEESTQSDDRQLQLESDADAVRIITMHSAKGLEFPLVFCPFLWASRKISGIQCLASPGKPLRLVNTGLPIPDEIREELFRADLEDKIRLAYVAITRAQVKVWIHGGANAGKNYEPSALDWLLRNDPLVEFSEWKSSTAESGKGALHTAGIELLQEQSKDPDLIALLSPPQPVIQQWENQVEDLAEPLLSLLPPIIPDPWILTSFSSLTKEKSPHGNIEVLPPEVSAGEESFPSNPFFSAIGGTMVGTAVHDWIQGWDFSPPDLSAIERHLKQYSLPANPFDQENSFHVAVGGMLEELRGALLSGLDCTIKEACPLSDSSEWHFHLPILRKEGLSAHSIASVFAQHGESEYAALLSELPADQLRGYLHGFIDRIAFHEGSWGVIDWKTNKLGTHLSDYSEGSLRSCAMSSHYLLQAHLYLVALRRFLGPKAQIPGAWIVFLRAVRAGTSEGILHVRPSEALMEGLDELFSQPIIRSAA